MPLQRWMTSKPHLFLDFRQAGYRCDNLDNTTVADYYIAQQVLLIITCPPNFLSLTILYDSFYFVHAKGMLRTANSLRVT